MSGRARLVRWSRHKLTAREVPARRLPELLAVAAVVVLVAITLGATTDAGGWSDVAHNQAVNVASAAAIGGFAYLLFVLRFRRSALKDYLEGCVSRPESMFPSATTLSGRAGRDEAVVAHCVVEDTVKSKNRRSHILISDVDASRRWLLLDVVMKLAERDVVPVVLELRGAPSASIASLARDRFVTQLVGAAGDSRNAARLFSFLVQRRRLVVVVVGLEQVAEAKPMAVRRERVAQLLNDCLVEGIVFVAAIDGSLAPQLSEVSAVRTGRMSPRELTDFFIEELDRGGLRSPALSSAISRFFHTTEPTRDPGHLRLAVRLVARHVRSGAPPQGAIETLFSDPCAFRRHLRWRCRWVLNCDVHEVRHVESPEATALSVLGLEAHYNQAPVLEVASACSGMDPAERRRVLAGLARLVERRVVVIATVDGSELVRFTHPGWLAFAGALAALDRGGLLWAELLGQEPPAATLDALTASLLLGDAPAEGKRSFVEVIRSLGFRESGETSLDLVRAVVTALQADSMPLDIGDEEISLLTRAWDDASEPVRLRTVSDLDVARHPRLVEFMWAQVVWPRFGRNSWRLRQAICRRLSGVGGTTWTVLAERWDELIAEADEADLSTVGRGGTGWERCGPATASLCWILPTLLLHLDGDDRGDAERLLSRLAAVVCGRGAAVGPGTRVPDIGLEVSLAEGFKVAAGDATTPPREHVPDSWRENAMNLFNSARSWLSRLVLVQTLGLTLGRDEAGRVFEPFDRVARDAQEHPFVREAAALLRQPRDPSGVVGKVAWLDDPETLEDGGLDLSPAAHRLLGLSTLLVNLSENVLWQARNRQAEAPADSGAAMLEEASRLREKALSGVELPACFTRRSHAATMFQHPCDCEFALCGPETLGPVGFRRLSRAFVQRSETVCQALPVTGSRLEPPFVLGAFRWSWRLLDQELSRANGEPALDR